MAQIEEKKESTSGKKISYKISESMKNNEFLWEVVACYFFYFNF